MLKRAFDIAVSLVALLLLSLVLAATALAIRFTSGRPVFFKQMRPGLNGKMFSLIKFRTMDAAVDAKGTPLPDEARLTRFGRLLRASSLDELPELWNVLCGDMSLVGPRPLLSSYLGRYTQEQMRRHEVRPGLTGWAQINGRNSISWEEKFTLDVWYVDHQSFWLDLIIILRTIWLVLRRQGITAEGHASMPEFIGNVAAENGPTMVPMVGDEG